MKQTQLQVLHLTLDSGEVVELFMRDELKELMDKFEEVTKKTLKMKNIPPEGYLPMWKEFKDAITGKVVSRKIVKDLRKREYIG